MRFGDGLRAIIQPHHAKVFPMKNSINFIQESIAKLESQREEHASSAAYHEDLARGHRENQADLTRQIVGLTGAIDLLNEAISPTSAEYKYDD